MQYIVPNELEIVNTNVPLNDYEAYEPTKTYNTGDKVTIASEKKNYFCAKDNTQNIAPQSNSEIWIDEAMNAYAMFDFNTSKQTQHQNLIEINIKSIGNADFIALFNIEASSVEITIKTADNEMIYQSEENAFSEFIEDFADYLYAGREMKDRISFSPNISYGANINIKIKNQDATAKCGYLAVGFQNDLGVSLYGGNIGFKSFTKKEKDEWGNTKIKKGNIYDTMQIPVLISTDRLDIIKQKLKKIDATPCVFMGDNSQEFDSLLIFGMYESFTAPINPQKLTYTLKVEAIQ